ncbi:MAG TPA: trehalose-6-phosphate synthase [Thermoanaerobaculia bacterium]|nr:trehalose-6-phosphate synthase [Thermoanaerobaculia bacterium]
MSIVSMSVPEPRERMRGDRFLIVSDRLPIVLGRGEEGWRAAPAAGALISALSPVLRERRGVWIGWPGVTAEKMAGLRTVLTGAIQEGGYPLRPVLLSENEERNCHAGFSGEVIWPLFHDCPLECNFDPSYWRAYQRVNRKFARAAAKVLSVSGAAAVSGSGGPGTGFLWVHNHLLMNVGAELRRLGLRSRTAFFLHLPFPGPDMFVKLPWRERILQGLLAYDQVGLQTPRDLVNFLDCVRLLTPGAELSPCADGLWSVRGRTEAGDFELRAGAFPIGVDARDFAARAARPDVQERAAALSASLRDRKMILGVDRLDRSKGIPEKLRAFAEALERQPELHDRVVLVQVVVPSREDLPRHTALRAEIERLVGEINGRFGRLGWTPIHYAHRALEPDELLAHYRAADVMLITPLKEGMNLLAKEYCAADLDERGALVLSEFAGAASQLADGALLVNPHDARATARTLVRALRMTAAERADRMRRLRERVRREDVSWWAGAFLDAAYADAGEIADIAGSVGDSPRRETSAGLRSFS